ncbi:hypothetical protein BIY26_17705 [Brenneria goodwinii]|uniref:Uncharacterized protein n=1 Tax=Brenneria goodwinii TaxID=1109412 RepID=A0AAE8JLP0_9GAMM|nr:hypothetical protein [Brenneria goodwinii]ATA23098.1 hypothetical protein AWC36_02675 [Brenneria goodwinii]RLM19135.1 hypothetical protein BIY26_17705 [Brenneria goodwinii]
MAILHPQECYLLERFTSLDFFQRRWQVWQDFVEHCEHQVALYSQNLPPQQRSLPLWQQYDVVWNNRILPNIRGTLSVLYRDYLQRQHNDPRAYFTGGNVASDCKGLSDYWPEGWMSEAALERYGDLLGLGRIYNKVIEITTGSYWDEGNLTYRYNERAFGPLDLPPQIPRYELDPSVVLGPNDPVTVTGIYLPDVEYASAQFFHPRSYIPHTANQGKVRSEFISDEGIHDYSWTKIEKVPATWTLIHRVENEFIPVPPQGFFPNRHPDELYRWPEREQALLAGSKKHLTLPSGTVCPHGGLWSTYQAGRIERQHFAQGDILPQWRDTATQKRAILWTLLERDDGGVVQFAAQ